MDDISEKLAGILNDPESMERVRRMAESLLGGQENTSASEQPSNDGGSAGGFSLPDGDELKTIMNILAGLKNTGGDASTQLLAALRPHLSEPRQEKVDTAIKMLRLIELLPLLRESGILNL